MDVELTVEERNLLSVAYKNVIGARRASWRIISSIEQKEENKGNHHHVEKIREYRTKVEAELHNICSDILRILDEHLIPSSQTGESKVFHYKMFGPFFLYIFFYGIPTLFLIGKEITTDILLNSPLVTRENKLLPTL